MNFKNLKSKILIFYFHYRWGGWSSNTKKDSSHKFKPLGQKDKDSQTFSSSTPKPTTTSRPISTTEPATYNSGGLADSCPRNGANPSTIQIPSLSETGTWYIIVC